MGRKERREREQRRENYAAKRSSQKRTQTLIAVGVLAGIAAIVGYAGWLFINTPETDIEGAGELGSDHVHAAILVKIFGDTFDFSAPTYQTKSPWIHFEGRDGTTIHKHATGVTLGYLFESLGLGLDDQCYTFQNGRNFCTDEDYSLKFYINGDSVEDIRDYEINENDRILISYGGETPEEIEAQIQQLDTQQIVK